MAQQLHAIAVAGGEDTPGRSAQVFVDLDEASPVDRYTCVLEAEAAGVW